MGIEKELTSEATVEFEKYLTSRNMRMTPERQAVLMSASTLRGRFTAETLQENVARVAKISVSRASVYNTLELLCQCRILHKLIYSRTAVYEWADSNHVHLICTKCGKVKGLKDKELKHQMDLRRYPAFTMVWHTTDVYGICSVCARKEKKKINKNSQKTK